jgi:hypothetical protein
MATSLSSYQYTGLTTTLTVFKKGQHPQLHNRPVKEYDSLQRPAAKQGKVLEKGQIGRVTRTLAGGENVGRGRESVAREALMANISAPFPLLQGEACRSMDRRRVVKTKKCFSMKSSVLTL